MNRYKPGNRLTLLRNGAQYFPALERAIDAARHEIWFETYIFADDPSGRRVAAALERAAQRGVKVRVLVDGWGAKFYLTASLEKEMSDAGVDFMRYRPEVAPVAVSLASTAAAAPQAVSDRQPCRLRRWHNVIDDANTPGQTTPPRADFAVMVEGPLLVPIVETMQRVWALVQLVRSGSSDVAFFPDPIPSERAGSQTAKFVTRDNLRHRRDIERAYLAAIRTAKREIIIANSYFFPGIRFRRALQEAAQRGVVVTLLLQARVEYMLLHFATRALYGQLLNAGIRIQEYHRSMLHAKVAVVDEHWRPSARRTSIPTAC